MRTTDPEMLQCAQACLHQNLSYDDYTDICRKNNVMYYSHASYNVLREEMNSIVLKYTGSIL